MNTEDILCILQKYKIFCGVYPSDMLPKKIHRPCAFIANTHPSTKPGGHWVGIYVSPKGEGEYFDSYGLPPLQKDIKNYMEEQCPSGWKYNPFALQDAKSFTCGYYCVSM